MLYMLYVTLTRKARYNGLEDSQEYKAVIDGHAWCEQEYSCIGLLVLDFTVLGRAHSNITQIYDER